LIELSNDAAKFLSLERLSPNMYQIQVSRSASIGLYHLDITVRDARGENLSQKSRIRVNVLVSFLFEIDTKLADIKELRTKSLIPPTALRADY
jgi:hypothetical protein